MSSARHYLPFLLCLACCCLTLGRDAIAQEADVEPSGSPALEAPATEPSEPTENELRVDDVAGDDLPGDDTPEGGSGTPGALEVVDSTELDITPPPINPDDRFAIPVTALCSLLLVLATMLLGRGGTETERKAGAGVGVMVALFAAWYAAALGVRVVGLGALCGQSLAHALAGLALLGVLRYALGTTPGPLLRSLVGPPRIAARSALLGGLLASIAAFVPILPLWGPSQLSLGGYPWLQLVLVVLFGSCVQAGMMGEAERRLRGRFGAAVGLITALALYGLAVVAGYVGIWRGPMEPLPMLVGAGYLTAACAAGLLLARHTGSALGLIPVLLGGQVVLVNLFTPEAPPLRLLISFGLILLAVGVLALLPRHTEEPTQAQET